MNKSAPAQREAVRATAERLITREAANDNVSERELINQVAQGVSEMRQRQDAFIAAGTATDAEIRASLKAHATQLAEMEATLQTVNRQRVLGGGVAAATERAAEQRDALAHFVRTGSLERLVALRAQETGLVTRATVGVSDVTTQGGLLILPEVDSAIERIAAVYSDLRQYATVRQIGTNRYEKPIKKSGTTGRWRAGPQDAARVQTDALAWGSLAIDVHELEAEPRYTDAFLADAYSGLEADILADIAETFAVLEAAAGVTGTGVGQWRGFMNPEAGFAAQTGAAEVAYGKIGYVASLHASEWTNGVAGDAFDAFAKVINRLKPQYLARAAFYNNRDTLADVMTFKDSAGQPLWQPSTQAGQPSTIRNFPVRVIEGMASKAANALPVAFGDMAAAYTIVDRAGLVVTRNPYQVSGQVLFTAVKRSGGGHNKTEALKAIKIAAA